MNVRSVSPLAHILPETVPHTWEMLLSPTAWAPTSHPLPQRDWRQELCLEMPPPALLPGAHGLSVAKEDVFSFVSFHSVQ